MAAAGLMAAACLATARPARAEIYSWRDEKGALVLSDRRLDPNAKRIDTSSVREEPMAPAVRTMKTTAVATRRRGSQYDAVIAAHAAAHDVRADLVRAVIQAESGFNPYARSSKGSSERSQSSHCLGVAVKLAQPSIVRSNALGECRLERERRSQSG
jgi:soluble lytic murein transglycosylase-like protein